MSDQTAIQKAELARAFDGAATEYEQGRPGYPDEAVDWLLQQAGHLRGRLDVVDVGAGTGKLTEALVARPMTVSAVEPLPRMRAVLAAKLPSVPVYEGGGEAIPLPSDSVDLVTFGQAWHWVNVPAASVEVARVLRPGGRLALVWNLRDDTVEWVARLVDVMGWSEAERYDTVTPPVGEPLRRLAYAEFRWQRPLSRAELLAMVASRSYVIAMTEADRTELLGAVEDLLDSHSELRSRDHYVLPYVTRVTVAGETG